MSRVSEADIIEAMSRVGVYTAEPDRLRMGGVLWRFAISDSDRRNRRRNGWCIAHTDVARPFIICGDWSKGSKETVAVGDASPLNSAERARERQAIEQAKATRDAKLLLTQAQAAQTANSHWNIARPASEDHPYLQKGIDAAGLRECGRYLVLPLRDSTGKIQNYQSIRSNGQKRFLRGARVTGLYASIGNMGDHVLICEGWATGKTLHAQTGLAVSKRAG